MKFMFNRTRLIFAITFFVSVTAMYVGRGFIFATAGSWLDVGTQPTHSDYVMVLPGNPQTRPFVAAAIVNAGLSERVIVLTTKVRPGVLSGLALPSDELERRILRARGISPGQVLTIAKKSDSTFDDANALAGFLRSNPDYTVQIVTNNFHTRRSRWVFRKVMGQYFKRIKFVSAPTDGYGPEDWWEKKRGTSVYVSEYLKLAFYFVRYGAGLYWLAACTLLLIMARIAMRRVNRARAGS